MYRKIDVYINGEYQFSTKCYQNIKSLVKHIRAVKHINIASLPDTKWLTVYDYDKIRAVYAE